MLLKVILVLLSLAVASQAQLAIGLNTTAIAEGLCANGCSWNTPSLYDSGTVPTSADSVTFNKEVSITINVDENAVMANFEMGTTSPDNKYTLNIKSGKSFTVGSLEGGNGVITFKSSSTVNIEEGASLVCGGQGTNNGVLSVAGTATFGGTKYALTLDSTVTLNPLDQTTAKLILNNGVVKAAGGLKINGVKATLQGVGNITGNVLAEGKINPGADDSTPGDIWIFGGLDLQSSATTTFNIKSKTEFDHIYLTGTIDTDGVLVLDIIDNYVPNNAQRFYIMNHTEFTNGFKSVTGSGLSSVFNNKWKILPDQENTIVRYGSASATVISMGLILVCLVASLL